MSERRDANRIALRAARSLLEAATDLRLEVEGTAVTVRVQRQPPGPWPRLEREGQDALDERSDGPWPAAVQAECTWPGGARTLRVEATYWTKGNNYQHLISLRVNLPDSGRELTWISLALLLRETVDGSECSVPTSFSVFKRKDENTENQTGTLKAMVTRSGIPLLSRARAEAFRVSVPTAQVLPSPAEAFRRLIHLALLKLPFLVRPDAEGGEVDPPWFHSSPTSAPLNADSASPTADEDSNGTERRGRLYPLPGGVRQFKTTLDELLDWFGDESHLPSEFDQHLKQQYDAQGLHTRQHYRRVLMSLGFVSDSAGRLSLTERGREYRKTRDPLELFEHLHATYQGMLETLGITEALGQADTRRTDPLLKELLDAHWESYRQTNVRQNWLLSLGLTERGEQGDFLTPLGQTALARYPEQARQLLEDIRALRDESLMENAPRQGLEDEALDEEDEASPSVSRTPGVMAATEEGEPAGWDADRLDLTPAHVQPQLGPLGLPSGVLERACAALSAGKHLLLTGPPGTGKTELAHALAQAARTEGYCRGLFESTASADWTTYETIGGYALERDKSLRFRAGAFLQAVQSWRWLLVDELNRADVDKAFGELMTVLGGRGTDTPFELEDGRRVSIGYDAGRTHRLSRTFRVIATMNTWDKTSLFRLSYAVQRRFAIVHVGLPEDETYARLISHAARGPGVDPPLDEEAEGRLLRLFRREGLLGLRDIGPAVALDLVRYMRRRAAPGAALAEALVMYLLPQLEGLDSPRARTAYELFVTALEGWASGSMLQELRSRCEELWPPGALPES